MEEPLLQRYIRQQPGLCRELLAQRGTLTAPFVSLWKSARPDRLVLVGSGSSCNAAVMARPLLGQVLGVEVTCLVPSEAGAFLRWAGGRAPLFVLISQSGISTNTYELAGELRRSGRPVLALTEGDDTPVAQAAGLSAALPVSDEHIGAKTKGVTATALALMLMGLAVRPDSALLTELEGLPGRMEETLRRAGPWCGDAALALASCAHLSVLGCGSALGAVREGALKLLETGYLPVSGYPLDEYVHGIQNALDRSAGLVGLLPASGDDRERMLRLARFARSVGAACVLLDPRGAASGALALAAAGEEALASLDFLPALQVLAAGLSAARGIDASRRRYPDFFSLMGSKLPEK